ncbi:Immediate early response 3-interacting protein 1, partial [Caenorhabditis elegans]
VVIVFKLILG